MHIAILWFILLHPTFYVDGIVRERPIAVHTPPVGAPPPYTYGIIGH